MKPIPLTQGREALVSDCDYHYLMQWRWCFSKHRSGKGGYAVRIECLPRQRTILMHKVVAARKGLAGEIDHRDQNKLNNQRSNLRLATRKQNSANRGRNCNNTSGYKGVSWHAPRGKWRAYIAVDGWQHHLKLWKSKREAARAYNNAARKYFGKYAALNTV